MATRAEVLAAYAANPKAELRPNEEAIQFWMNNDLGQFNTLVDQVRAANPTLASQIDRDRAAAVTTGGGGTGGNVVTGGGGGGGGGNVVDNSARYRQLVLDAYANIGRTGIGSRPNQADQAGVDFWTNALINGTLTPENFGASFNNAVSAYIAQNPTDLITQNVNAYRPFANTGLLSQSQMQPQSMGAPAMPNYQPQSLAQNFQNYMGIPIGAQYNPAVTAGGASPYSQIRAISPQFVNPYAGTVANTQMGGYNPMLYENVKEAARLAGSLAPTDYIVGSDLSGGGGDSGGGGSDGNTGGGPGTGAPGDVAFAKGGMVQGLIGPNPPGPDDGAGYLQKGEYVIKKSSVDKYGKGLLDMINEGKVPVKKAKSLLF
jgi:uncharacterized membrane protein YgcG